MAGRDGSMDRSSQTIRLYRNSIKYFIEICLLISFYWKPDLVSCFGYNDFHDWNGYFVNSCNLRTIWSRNNHFIFRKECHVCHRHNNKSRYYWQKSNLKERKYSFSIYQKGDSETTRRLSLRILLGCWLLMVVVLINAYTGTLTSHMTVPKWKPIPESLEELAKMSKDYKITIKDSHLLADSFLVMK